MISLLGPGIYTPNYRAFPVFTEFSGDLLCAKKERVTQCRIELTLFRLLILSYTPRPQLPGTTEHQIQNIKPFSDISGTEECKIPAWARDMFSLAHAVILHSSMLEDISSIEE